MPQTTIGGNDHSISKAHVTLVFKRANALDVFGCYEQSVHLCGHVEYESAHMIPLHKTCIAIIIIIIMLFMNTAPLQNRTRAHYKRHTKLKAAMNN